MFEKIYLASSSPRRKELLTQLQVQFIQLEQNFDETPLLNEGAEQYVQRLAIGKAQSAIKSPEQQQDLPVLGADTIVVLDGQLLGKPKDLAGAKKMLQGLSGQVHHVFSAVALYYQDSVLCELSKTEVTFNPLTATEIDAYCQTKEPFGKAGAYAIQGIAGSFVTSLKGSYSGVVGLPLYETSNLLKQLNVRHWLTKN